MAANLAANNADNQLKIAAAGGIEAVVAAMAVHKARAGLQEEACWTLRLYTYIYIHIYI